MCITHAPTDSETLQAKVHSMKSGIVLFSSSYRFSLHAINLTNRTLREAIP